MRIFCVNLQGDAAANALTIHPVLQDAMYETWSSGLDDWDSREYEDSELIDALYMVRLVLCRSSLACALGAASFPSCAILGIAVLQAVKAARKALTDTESREKRTCA